MLERAPREAPPPCNADQSQNGTSKGLFFIVTTTTTPGGVTEVLLEPQHNRGNDYGPDQQTQGTSAQ